MPRKKTEEFQPHPPSFAAAADAASLDAVLTVLRKHGVSKYTRGGVSVEFFAGQTPHESRALLLELEADLAKAPSTTPAEPGRVEVAGLPLDDILPAGVQ